VRPGQARQRRADLAGGQIRQHCGRGGGDIRARVDRQQPEHPRGGLVLPAVGQLERRRDRRRTLPAAVVIPQRRQPVFFPAVRPPGCDCGLRNQQERDDYAAPALLDDFELTIWS
jgi:hypothetical protein